jgi:hypothetical protein
LKNFAHGAYYDDHELYLSAVGANKIQPLKKAKSIASYLQDAMTNPDRAKLERRQMNARGHLNRIQSQLASARMSYSKDIVWKDLMRDKKNHNAVGKDNLFLGIGPTKMAQLIVHETYYQQQRSYWQQTQKPMVYTRYVI